MSTGNVGRCLKGHDGQPSRLMVTQRLCNHSAFNGYHYTPSDYSTVRCCQCGVHWRTKASYVRRLPDAPEGWHNCEPEALIAWFDRKVKSK
jgi:hypothetical protein